MENKQTNISESKVVSKIKNGDGTTFKILFDTYYQAMVNIAHRYVLDKDVAESIVEDIFVNIWDNRERWRITSSIKAYLFYSTRNGSLNYLKHVKIKISNRSNIERTYNKVRTPYDELLTKELSEEIYYQIDKLPLRTRQIFKMHRFENLKYSEIAKLLNISQGTVETHMVRALKLLRSRLSHLLPIKTAK